MKTNCKECPHFIKNKHNDKILEFINKTNKKHKCHLINSDIWNDINENNECIGSLLKNKHDKI